MQIAHLITGGTGFVGSALILELLENTDVHVVCLVRGQDPQARLAAALNTAAEAYGVSDALLARARLRCHAVSGDVQLPGCGIDALPPFHYDQLWHSAASLRFEDRYAEEIFAINLEGTRRVLELAQRVGVRCFNYVSTAYVAGSMKGRILEASIPEDVTNNLYEKSKLQAERLVEANPHFGKRILRPSIVIGHSRRLTATNYTGMYGFLRKLFGFRGVMERAQADLMRHKSLYITGEAEIPLDFVPIDCVVSNAVRIAARTTPHPGETLYFHLNNPVPPTVGNAVSLMFAELEMQRPTFVTDTDQFEWLDEKFNSRTDFYRTYFRGAKHFDRANTERLVTEHRAHYEMPEPVLRSHYRWYIERLHQERQELPASR